MFEGLGTLIVIGIGEKMAGLAAFGTATKLTPLAILTVAAIPLVITGVCIGAVSILRKNRDNTDVFSYSDDEGNFNPSE